MKLTRVGPRGQIAHTHGSVNTQIGRKGAQPPAPPPQQAPAGASRFAASVPVANATTPTSTTSDASPSQTPSREASPPPPAAPPAGGNASITSATPQAPRDAQQWLQYADAPTPADGPAGATCPGVGAGGGDDSGVATLARRFAPVLVFSDKAQGYPTTAQEYYAAGCAAQVCSRDVWLPRPLDPCAHVYYAATWCPAEEGEGDTGRQLRIRYHFFFGWQAVCTSLEVGAKSEHQSDWEWLTLFLSRDKTRVAAVAYGQHGGWYTRVAGRQGFEEADGRPVVYVGRYMHGLYHDAHRAVGTVTPAGAAAAAAAAAATVASDGGSGGGGAEATGGAEGDGSSGGGDAAVQPLQAAGGGQQQEGAGGEGEGGTNKAGGGIAGGVVDLGKAVGGLFSKGASAVTEGVGAAACTYFGDPRGRGQRWNTGDTVLVDLQSPVPAEPWIAATLAAPDQRIFWEAGKHIDFGVSRWAPPCNMTACRGKGWDVTALVDLGLHDAGCARTQCLTGWKESGGTRCLRCPPGGGYRDCGLGYCAKGGSAAACLNPFANRASYQSTGHNYTIPNNDEGLL